ncbi:hypothetical protein Tco_0933656 [Tanacetum coccineum]
MVETLRVIRDIRREMSDMQADLLALREQQRELDKARPEARITSQPGCSRDAASHLTKGSLTGDLFPSAPSAIFTTMAHHNRNAQEQQSREGILLRDCRSTAPGHFKRDVLSLKKKDEGMGSAQGGLCSWE